jgi:alpha-L-glutamate ligase-like protein
MSIKLADEVMGMNARNQLYVHQNSAQARQFCHSKLATKVLLQNTDIPTAQIYQICATHEDIEEFDWHTLHDNFVIKPTNGSGGKGILVFRSEVKPGSWRDTLGDTWTAEQLQLHCNDILEGKYSTHLNSSNNVIIEERIPIHPLFQKYSYGGTPDIRVIVYNSVPVMAMLRLPTKESEGRANLHQGAIGVGVDLATGITIHAITGSGLNIRYVPGTKRKLNGIVLPFWHKTLLTAVQAANTADLTYGGIDLFIHKEKGPMVVEMNTQPGLSIQLANQRGLKKSLPRVEGLNILSAEHGVKIAQTLFASALADKFVDQEKKIVIPALTQSTVHGRAKKRATVQTAVNTSRYRSSISRALAEELDLYQPEDMLWFQEGERGEKNPIIAVTFNLQGRKVSTTMAVSQALDKGKNKIILGRHDLADFLVET